ncbi:energy transducer TonB [Chryseobacterium taihuense]|uniref:Protein TonB n=1 Tax=Chryseobacterium taihuense TaxID=1141221 RepID=A0ABY0QWR7_9FLAO|nr:energy transducer TonB [Chryseobacterium taihuense]SDM03831.1 protein TonB [Chryseobacterium taihuense]
MKKTLILFALLSSTAIFSQEITQAKEKNTENTIYESLADKAEYPGGLNAFRKKFMETFKIGKVNGSGQVKSEVRFVIDQQGFITDIQTIGANDSMNREMERTLKKISKTKWEPAKLDGIPVKYRFKLPITVNIGS